MRIFNKNKRARSFRTLSGLVATCFLANVAMAAESDDQIKKGEYLARASDCQGCHMSANGNPYGGGRSFTLPGMGTVYAPNITADKETGIGRYTDDEFVNALQKGVGHNGKYLYPVMPYTSYTIMSRDDILAIKAYLNSLPAVHASIPANKMNFPFNIRIAMAVWNLLNNPDERFKSDINRSSDWNRGKYLVEGPGHCAECHSPRNIFMGKSHKHAYAGSKIMGWISYNISSDPVKGIGSWSDEDLEHYLSTGWAEGHGAAVGPMAEAVTYSLHYLTPQDIHAIVVYLRSLPPRDEGEGAVKLTPEMIKNRMENTPEIGKGASLFQGMCYGCHQYDGTGRQVSFATLWGARTVSNTDGTNLVHVILEGASLPSENGPITMPGFDHGNYSNKDLADLANYVVAHFSGRKSNITPDQVQSLREK